MSKTIRNYLIIGIICLLVGAGITGIVAGKQLYSLRESEAAVVSSIAELRRESNELAGSIAAVKTGLDGCTSTIAALGGAVQRLGGTIQQLGASVETIKSDIREINARQSDVDIKLSELGNAISDFGETLHGLTGSVSNASGGLQQAMEELSGSDDIIDEATGILLGLPSAGSQGTK